MKDGVGQLAFTLWFPATGENDETQETQDNGSDASIQPAAAGSKTTRKHKWHSLIDKVYAPQNLQSAWERVRVNNGAPGLDGMTVQKFAEGAEERLQLLAQDLRAKTYRPQPVRRVFIEKSGGGQRPLGIPTVRDRIVQQALLQVLEPIFEGKFSHRSHGFRPGRGCGTALHVVDRAVKCGYPWVVDADIRSFFDTVDHERLLAAVNEEVADGSVLKLIRRILKAGVSLPDAAEIEATELGTPQGGPVSPLLANIYLHAFDVKVAQAGYGLVRYADDFIIFAKTSAEAEKALETARDILEGDLGLQLHPEKTRVVSVDRGFEFLGFHYFRDEKSGKLCKEVREKSIARFRAEIRKRTPRLRNQRKPKESTFKPTKLARNQQLRRTLTALNRYLRGWHWYFKDVWSRYDEPFDSFDCFVRRRVRSSIVGRPGPGWWNRDIPNKLLYSIGLVPLADWHQRYHNDVLIAPARKGRLGGEPYAGKPHVRFGKAGGPVTPPGPS